MARLTQIGGLDMRTTLSGNHRAVVAGCAGKRGEIVREPRRCPGVGAVAAVTFQCRRDVLRILARCKRAVVTCRARRRGHVMRKVRRYPAGRRMTGIALERRWNVGWALARRHGSIVANRASAKDFVVVDERHAVPTVGGVTTSAHLGRGYVRRGLAQCRGSVVATLAVSHHFGMLDPWHLVPGDWRMTFPAPDTCLDVVGRFDRSTDIAHTGVAIFAIRGER